MTSQKIENLLNLALDATGTERLRSVNLQVGYNEMTNTWDVIILYSGTLERVSETAESVTPLLKNFAIVRIREENIEKLASLEEVIYIEKPKRLFFEVADGRRVSCIDAVQTPRFRLTGKGVLIGVIDSGIEYANADFRQEDGATRIRFLWDQTVEGTPPEGYRIGSEFSAEQINEALQQPNRTMRLQKVPSVDSSGHGTAVAGVAAGNGRNSGGRYRGTAPDAELIIVKLGNPGGVGFPRTAELMQAVDYIVQKAEMLQMPVSVNISFGNTYGAHNGTSLPERFLDAAAQIGRTLISVGTGNEGAEAGHTSGFVREGEETSVPLGVQERQGAFSLQIWTDYTDVIGVTIKTPSGERVGPIREVMGTQRFLTGKTEILLYYGEPSPYSGLNEIFLEFLPVDDYVNSGEWNIILVPEQIVTGRFEMWLPASYTLNEGTAFFYPTEELTLTIPSTASRVLTVAAYDADTMSYADFSGRGRKNQNNQKPDLAAPGVNVVSVQGEEGYASFTGTSFAAPFASGGAALLMEWGITEKNDLFLYGEKAKAFLRRGARELPGYDSWPNNQLGYGALCIRDSIPETRVS
ncbi:peptidase S8 [Drancourtella sp. An12]|uniref:S8 family peptidase n=1 Tax=Drancourtella sp. An12 TaxID=1965548 RepID=UPI000B38ADDE|nr:S8 family peptidase [Drancourtella sp. An12]OUQ45711.1 peptidase S8 [Drancourtella sp. An12]HIV95114.1 S8 family serine peptidase [Candidatus Sellimonas avistercoris]